MKENAMDDVDAIHGAEHCFDCELRAAEIIEERLGHAGRHMYAALALIARMENEPQSAMLAKGAIEARRLWAALERDGTIRNEK